MKLPKGFDISSRSDGKFLLWRFTPYTNNEHVKEWQIVAIDPSRNRLIQDAHSLLKKERANAQPLPV